LIGHTALLVKYDYKLEDGGFL